MAVSHPQARHQHLLTHSSFLTAWIKLTLPLPTYSGNALFNSSALECFSSFFLHSVALLSNFMHNLLNRADIEFQSLSRRP